MTGLHRVTEQLAFFGEQDNIQSHIFPWGNWVLWVQLSLILTSKLPWLIQGSLTQSLLRYSKWMHLKHILYGCHIWNQPQDNCWVCKWESIATMRGKVSLSSLAPEDLINNDNWDHTFQLYPNTTCFPSWLNSPAPGPPACEQKEAQACASSTCTPDSPGLSQHCCPGACLDPPQTPLLQASGLCWWCTQLLSGTC